MAHFGPTPRKLEQYPLVAGKVLPVAVDRRASDDEDLRRLGLVEGRPADDRVDLLDGQPGHLFGRSRHREEAACSRVSYLLESTDGDHTGDELLEHGGVTVGREGEQDGPREVLDSRANPREHFLEVERQLLGNVINWHPWPPGGSVSSERQHGLLPAETLVGPAFQGGLARLHGTCTERAVNSASPRDSPARGAREPLADGRRAR